ncbi:MAG: hypothetical protein CMH91_04540 [Oceanicaulis sp.]|uniref:Gfo/Idh/MocA family oxidoreductase n=1 Tax=unclassified Oceanicaulis TaxID=2632123 RepID=UPI000C46739E|nr:MULTISPECIES: Gfo/Idh/MocA family oxidoreductase [unclassified Oceanicaulis]MAB70165.1 hypothetical protein [Oceanicaulis sp.]MBC38320.1 hypothetical protein [Oceanicaulis sp.]MBG36419.1 hypothetical protein [Oceanicaulis sp.]HCR93535.1 hypothetical protein [Oceanicaulis sp.]
MTLPETIREKLEVLLGWLLRTLGGVWRFIGTITTFPPRSSWYWGDRNSMLAWALFNTVALVRFISPLQWWKRLYRKDWSNRSSSKRPNFHALHTERYFVSVMIVAVAAANLFPDALKYSPFVMPVVILLTIETIGWIFYYLFVRNFVEPDYTLYHRAEYFVLLPVVVVAQIALLSILYESPMVNVFFAIFGGGAGEDASPQGAWELRLLGLCYLALIIGNLRMMYPETRFKQTTVFSIIGYGDVTRNRILPALKALEVPGRRYDVMTDELSNAELGEAALAGLRVQGAPPAQIEKQIKAQRHPVYIATPTPSHMDYIQLLADEGIRFVVEKPISAHTSEIAQLKRRAAVLFKDGFAASYYTLEKSLPLTYLYNPHRSYLKYLEFSEGLPKEYASITRELGALEAARIEILEGPDRSPSHDRRLWTLDPTKSGELYETFIHTVTVALSAEVDLQRSNLLSLNVGTFRNSPKKGCPTLYSAVLETPGQARIVLSSGKYMPEASCRRSAEFVFSGGRLTMDFNAKRLDIKTPTVEGHIRVRDEYQCNYAVSMSLAMDFMQNGWSASRFDDLDNQLEALSWLVSSSPFHTQPPTLYDDEDVERLVQPMDPASQTGVLL